MKSISFVKSTFFLVLLFLIPLSSYACPASVPAGLYIKNVISNEDVLLDAYYNTIGIPENRELIGLPYLNISSEVTEVKIVVNDQLITLIPVSDLEFDDSHQVYLFPNMKLRSILYGENYDWKTGTSLKQYNNSIVKILYNDEPVAELEVEFRNAIVIPCRGYFPLFTWIVGIFVVILVISIFLWLRKK